jgi:RNA polymerase sigma-70 factor (ECF subfamily)
MTQSRREIVAWVGAQILPHEADVRARLRRTGTHRDEIDDIVQEAYCRLAAMPSVEHIVNGRAYFFQTARNIVIERIRHARVVRIDSVTEIDALNVVDSEPSQEQVVASRHELRRVQELIESLPPRCRDIFKLRRVYGMPQREIARRLGVSENVVEMQVMRGLRLILRALSEGERPQSPRPDVRGHEGTASRQRDR